MMELTVITGLVALLAAFGAAAIRWGVDSRTWTTDGHAMSLFSR
jgi:Tfp pilus assembly protein FimT